MHNNKTPRKLPEFILLSTINMICESADQRCHLNLAREKSAASFRIFLRHIRPERPQHGSHRNLFEISPGNAPGSLHSANKSPERVIQARVAKTFRLSVRPSMLAWFARTPPLSQRQRAQRHSSGLFHKFPLPPGKGQVTAKNCNYHAQATNAAVDILRDRFACSKNPWHYPDSTVFSVLIATGGLDCQQSFFGQA